MGAVRRRGRGQRRGAPGERGGATSRRWKPEGSSAKSHQDQGAEACDRSRLAQGVVASIAAGLGTIIGASRRRRQDAALCDRGSPALLTGPA